MDPKMIWKKLGAVNIFELKGSLSGACAVEFGDQVKEIKDSSPADGTLVNVRGVRETDAAGVQTVQKALEGREKRAVWGRNLSSYFLQKKISGETLPVFETSHQVVEYFQKEFATAGEGIPKERRKFPRIEMSLPIEFGIKGSNEPFRFEGVVCNLSEGGLYAFFLESDMEEMAARLLNPFDLKLLVMRLTLSRSEDFTAEGKVVRIENLQGHERGVGLEFYHLNDRGLRQIRAFLQDRKTGKEEL